MKISNLQNWFLSKTKFFFQNDHLIHFTVGFFLFLGLMFITEARTALLIVFLMSILKEVIYDKIIRKVAPDPFDIFYTILPGVVLIIKFAL